MANAPAFWGDNPNVLVDPTFRYEWFPVGDMDYNRQLNAITRMTILVTVVWLLVAQQPRILVVGALTIVAIYFVHQQKQKQGLRNNNKNNNKEGYVSQQVVLDYEGIQQQEQQEQLKQRTLFQAPTVQNPFGNVLVTDYDDRTTRLPAAPIDQPVVSQTILDQAKELVREMHPEQPEVSEKLFRDLGEQFTFEQSMRPFYSMPNTSIPNDQQAFTNFCYGNMVSCKEGNELACARNLLRHVANN